jgi:hypothetical protein
VNEEQQIEDVLCIGLDIAWFGGSAHDKDSQHDCLGAVLISSQADYPVFTLTRVHLENRDSDSVHLLKAIDKLLECNNNPKRIIFALDAPIQARDRGLPPRPPLPSKGMVERRACENYLDEKRKLLDKSMVKSRKWRPNIQPGAPLAPRVMALLDGLQQRDFTLWTHENQHVEKLVIECFPAEAIWALKQMEYYSNDIIPESVKAYKKQKKVLLTSEQVNNLTHDVLDSFAPASGNLELWSFLIDNTVDWLKNDQTWQNNGFYRGGKLLDDVVDTMICLATSLSYAYGQAHVWQDPEKPEDGHIIGPGFSNNGVFSAYSGYGGCIEV